MRRKRENAAALAYFKTGFLLFASILMVWGPSSVNRLYQVAHPENPSYGLSFVSALVLPMQGFWNAMIYMTAVWAEHKRAYATVVSKFTGDTLTKHSSNHSVPDVPIKFHEDIGVGSSLDVTTEPNSSALIV